MEKDQTWLEIWNFQHHRHYSKEEGLETGDWPFLCDEAFIKKKKSFNYEVQRASRVGNSTYAGRMVHPK